MTASSYGVEEKSGTTKVACSPQKEGKPSRAHTGHDALSLSAEALSATITDSGCPRWACNRLRPTWVNTTTKRTNPAVSLKTNFPVTLQI